ncbi:hypothetical protein H4218_003949 [Coemansia sp. IMI 209128]|nr:hypothetical protein H4218_003949 [Coemansia sp. IMI 209128]
MTVFVCKSCQLVFDSREWYENHAQKTHGLSKRVSIGSILSSVDEEAAIETVVRRPWRTKLLAVLRIRTKG